MLVQFEWSELLENRSLRGVKIFPISLHSITFFFQAQQHLSAERIGTILRDMVIEIPFIDYDTYSSQAIIEIRFSSRVFFFVYRVQTQTCQWKRNKFLYYFQCLPPILFIFIYLQKILTTITNIRRSMLRGQFAASNKETTFFYNISEFCLA